jgi:hypothetical protein
LDKGSLIEERMTDPELDLVSLFNNVTKTLKGNQELLNEADTYNHNHGDNMVKNFRVITKAMKTKQGSSPTEMLDYASQILSQSSSSGSTQLYSRGLSQAADQFKGQDAVTSKNALGLVQALMSSGQPPQSTTQTSQAPSGDMMGDLLGSLLGGGGSMPSPSQQTGQTGDVMGDLLGSLLGGGGSSPSTSQPQAGQSGDMMGDLLGSLLGGGGSAPSTSQPQTGQSGDMLGELLGSLLGGGSAPQSAPSGSGSTGGGGFDLGNLLTIGMAYLQAKQQGASPIEAIIKAIMANSQMNDTPSHSQSGQLVAGTLINTITSMLSGKQGRTSTSRTKPSYAG